MSKFLAVLFLSLGATTAAHAGGTNPLCTLLPFLCGPSTPTPPSHGNPTAAPEIDPASAISGLMLLSGGLVVLRGRRRK